MQNLVSTLKEEKVDQLRKIVFLSSSGVESSWYANKLKKDLVWVGFIPQRDILLRD